MFDNVLKGKMRPWVGGWYDVCLMYARGTPTPWNTRPIKSQSNLKKKSLLCWFVEFDLPSKDD